VKKLSLLVQVGFSHDDLDRWRVHPWIVNEMEGWNAFVRGDYPRHSLSELVHSYGPTFDIWLLWPAGIHEPKYLEGPGYAPRVTVPNPKWREHLFSGVLDAPSWLTDYSPLLDYCKPLGIGVYGYIGRPYFDHWSTSAWVDVIDAFTGFAGLGFDSSGGIKRGQDAGCTGIFDEMRRKGMIPFLEAAVGHNATHLHGYPVMAEQHLWENEEEYNEHGLMRPDDIRARGGFTLHTLNMWEPGTSKKEKQKIRHKKTLELLPDNYVGVPFDQLVEDDPAAEIVRASQ
jgi:hypothetical protein